jgi:hypothetical protein
MLQRINNTLGRMMIAGDETSWDYGFMESIRDQVQNGRTLSPNQERHLQQIEGRWSDEALASRADFAKGWDDDKEQKFAIALQYYRKTGYYSNIVYKYLTPEGARQVGTPSEKEYNKLVLNKYATGVIRNIQGESKFPVGGTAVFRAGARTNKGKPCVILKHGNTEHVTSHAKGAKPIQVLPIGSAEPYWTEERWLKKAKKKK